MAINQMADGTQNQQHACRADQGARQDASTPCIKLTAYRRDNVGAIGRFYPKKMPQIRARDQVSSHNFNLDKNLF